MTIAVRQHHNPNYYIVLELKHNHAGWDYYEVNATPIYSNGTYGYPVRNMVYSVNELKQAKATFNRYKRKYV